jgi:S-formylglutathione hydrolase FrmB
MGRDVSYSTYLPDNSEGPYPVLLQLHGLGDNNRAWIEKSMLVMHARKYPLAIVMPDGASSGYLNWTDAARLYRQKYEDMIMTDISDHVRRHFNVADGPWAIGGLSMGGYGSMRLGLKYPDRFASIWSHSSAFHIDERIPAELVDDGGVEDASVPHHAEVLAATNGPKPVISFDCGVDDQLIESNRAFDAHLTRLGVDHHYAEHPGAHTWGFWNEHVQEALDQHARVFGLDQVSSHFT